MASTGLASDLHPLRWSWNQPELPRFQTDVASLPIGKASRSQDRKGGRVSPQQIPPPLRPPCHPAELAERPTAIKDADSE